MSKLSHLDDGHKCPEWQWPHPTRFPDLTANFKDHIALACGLEGWANHITTAIHQVGSD